MSAQSGSRYGVPCLRPGPDVARDVERCMLGLRHSTLFFVFVVALSRPAAAGAFVFPTAANGQARVGAVELVAATLVGPASAASPGLIGGIGAPRTSYFGWDELARVAQAAHDVDRDDLELTPGDVWQDAPRFHARGFDDSANWSSIERHDFAYDTVLSYADVPSHFYGAYGVDDSGRTEWYTRPDGVAVRVEYGPFDEISVVCDDANGSEDCFNVRVDALGRVAQILDENGNEVRAYQYAEGRVLIERTPAGETLLVMAGGEIPQAIVPDGEDPLWVHPGWNDRVAALSNADGEIVARYETSAFGEVTALDPDGYPWADPYDSASFWARSPRCPSWAFSGSAPAGTCRSLGGLRLRTPSASTTDRMSMRTSADVRCCLAIRRGSDGSPCCSMGSRPPSRSPTHGPRSRSSLRPPRPTSATPSTSRSSLLVRPPQRMV